LINDKSNVESDWGLPDSLFFSALPDFLKSAAKYLDSQSPKMSDLRQRKPVLDVGTQPQEKDQEEDEPLSQQDPPDISPDLRVVVSLLIGLMIIIITYYYYRVDLNSKGPLSTFVNDKILGRNPYERAVIAAAHNAPL
jgi:hypothetical protein